MTGEKKRKEKKRSVSYQTTSKMRLNFFWFHIFNIQDVKLSFSTIQDPLTVQHALFKVSRLLEKLIFCGDLPQFPLQRAIQKANKVKDRRKNSQCLPSKMLKKV